MKDLHFKDFMNNTEVDVWSSFTKVVQNFLWNYKAENYTKLVKRMRHSFSQLGFTMSRKLYYPHSNLDPFPENFGELTEEQGGRFRQDLRTQDTEIPTRSQIIAGLFKVIA